MSQNPRRPRSLPEMLATLPVQFSEQRAPAARQTISRGRACASAARMQKQWLFGLLGTAGWRSSKPAVSQNDFGAYCSRSDARQIADRAVLPPIARVSLRWGRGQRSTCHMLTPSLPRIIFKRPFVSRETAAAALDKWTVDIDALIENGDLRWAFDFAVETSKQKYGRILAESLFEFQTGQRAARGPEAEEFARVVRVVFPMIQPARPGVVLTVCATTVARRFSVESELILNLCREGSLRFARGTKCGRGPGNSPQIQFDSVVNFLRERRIR